LGPIKALGKLFRFFAVKSAQNGYDHTMKMLIQRVSQASVETDGEQVGAIGRGVLVLLGIDRSDTEQLADRLLDKLLDYRVFPDGEGRMNCSVKDTGGGVLLVSQFTLSADTRKGLRPSFSSAAPPDQARHLYEYCLARLRSRHRPVAAGVFGADMAVSLINDGPVTFLLEA
jgi:D-tyrosyl-tRNA(Tyr) deacylase